MRTLLLIALVAVFGYGCDGTAAPPTTPEPEATYVDTPESVGGGGDGLTTLGGPVALRVPIREGSIDSFYRYPASEDDRRRGTHRYDIGLEWPQPENMLTTDFYFYMVKADHVGVRGGKVSAPSTMVAIGPNEFGPRPGATANGIRLPPNSNICAKVRHKRLINPNSLNTSSRTLRYMDLGCRRTGAAPAPYVAPEPEPAPEPVCGPNERTAAEWEEQITCDIAWKRSTCSNFILLSGQSNTETACCHAAGARANVENYGGRLTGCLLPGHLHYGDSQ